MKRTFKIFLLLLVLLTLSLTLSSCKYTSSYKAIGLLRTSKPNYCYAKFHTLDGKLIFRIKNTNVSEGNITYSAKLEKGEINVYYDSLNNQELLFNIKEGETLNSKGGYIESGKYIYIIIETVVPSRGNIEIKFEKN